MNFVTFRLKETTQSITQLYEFHPVTLYMTIKLPWLYPKTQMGIFREVHEILQKENYSSQ